ncbi:MAG: hypothetical protein K0R05_2481 [Anaerocolumna sp.]|jgi:hypothetical protein|nr:hypothetical protein [Anaerocolumna sp.]
MRNKKKLNILIHGPFQGNAYEYIFEEINKLSPKILKAFNIVVVVYTIDYEDTIKTIKKYNILNVNIKLIQIKDLLNPGFFNINRQLVSVMAGLKDIEPNEFVVKLRNDQWISFNKLLKLLKNLNYFENGTQKILTTNCFSRKDRLYHPSDMFLCGLREELLDYYDCDLMEETHMDCQLRMVNLSKNSNEKFHEFFICPEIILFKNYLKNKNWEFKNTKEDSYNAIKAFCYIVNSWNIDFRWNKKRNPFMPAGSIVLPYSYKLEPFEGAPKEYAQNYSEYDITNKMTIKDIYFIIFSRIIFYLKYDGQAILRDLIINIAYSKYMPEQIRTMLKHTPIYKIFRYILK